MSAVSTAKPKKVDPLSKKTPENPKYAHIKSTLDTGSSVTKYLNKIEDIKKNYRYKVDEVFKRMKITTFVQLIVQVAEYDARNSTQSMMGNGDYTERPDTADLEVQHIQRGSPGPSPAVTEGDHGEGLRTGARSTLQGGYDNLFLLSGGMRIAYRFFPEGLLTGTPNQNITDSSKPPKTKEKASQKSFNTFDLEKLHSQLDRELSDRSVGSRLSNASTVSSRMGQTSTSRFSNASGSVSGRPPFKPC
ncbi:centrosomal protein of 41 kDa-like [Ostrea edulis]|uniref:centrosomal protein of 41 kDa-like n=1 Tax=Ostrea edulis TaxID=37623 RepID=UPI0024AEE352|nr:centrosomal protein of 41 kDa-like [Ostrea edulis]